MARVPFKTSDGSLRTTPWQRREPGGVYVGHDRSVWLFRQLPLAPLKHEDPRKRLEAGGQLEDILIEIGMRSKDLGQGVRTLAQTREVHIFGVTYNTECLPPADSTEQLEDFLDDVLPAYITAKALLVGVKLRSSALADVAKAQGVKAKLKAVAPGAADPNVSNLEVFADDFADIDTILRRGGGTVPSDEALAQLECWWNFGLTPDVAVEYDTAAFSVAGAGTYELRAVSSMPTSMTAPFAQWLLDAMAHEEPAVAVSIRAELEPATLTRSRLRKQRRRLIAQEAEEAATGDLGREENASRLELAEDIESLVQSSRTPWLANTSILLAKRVESDDDDYADFLKSAYKIETVALVDRQLEALDEFQPTSTTRVAPFPQDLNPAMVAYAGAASYSNLGDASGMFGGLVDPDGVPWYISPFAAARENVVPVMGVFGDPGSGKTFAAQLLTGQAVLGGYRAFFVNPKSADSLRPWAEWLRDHDVPVQVVSMSQMEEDGGAFDPFGFCANRQTAAEILTRHIQTCLGDALSAHDQWVLTGGLAKGAAAGARTAFEALQYVDDQKIIDLVTMAASSDTLVALAFARVPRDYWDTTAGLTLIEFDRELALPKAGKQVLETPERVAVAAMRLVSRAALEMLLQARGGVLVIDEAHHYINSPEGLSSMDKLAREGRSMSILPIFISQKPSDLLNIDMESFMSRVLCMKLSDPNEAAAALRICMLEATAGRIETLRKAGPQPRTETEPGTPARGFLRDQRDRHALVTIGPVPEDLRLAMSTNRTDRELRDEMARTGTTTEAKEAA